MSVVDLLTWGPWYPLNGASRNEAIPHQAGGLYRIRKVGSSTLSYIGQTGPSSRGFRGRMSNLLGIYKDIMPYRDPHTAAPALWVQSQMGEKLEVSVCSLDVSPQWRKGMEALAIFLYRQAHRMSPDFNFGRMPTGYKMPSGNNSKLKALGKLTRGQKTEEHLSCHINGISPMTSLDDNVTSFTWCGHKWSPWFDFSGIDNLSEASTGLYRIKSVNDHELLYIGEGKIKSRLKAHINKVNRPQDPQGRIFVHRDRLQLSWVNEGDWRGHKHQRLELENDLIAAHILETRSVPKAQFLGK
jgi:hypothetical protein